MAVQTPIANSTYDIVAGSIRMQIVKFASVANADTFVSDLGTIICVVEGGGSTATPYCGVSWSGSTLTFNVTSGPILNLPVMIIGF
jgi:hypothetical protein